MTEESKRLVTCPCCGKETFPVSAELDPQIIDAYMACTLSEKPFTYTYKLFDNKIAITCQEPENKAYVDMGTAGDLVASITDEEVRKLASLVLYKITALWPILNITIMLDGQIKSYEVHSLCVSAMNKFIKDKCKKQTLLQLLDNLNDPAKVSSLTVTMLNKVLTTHSRTVELLNAVGFDQDFYKGIPHI